jgi:hypothetical protein
VRCVPNTLPRNSLLLAAVAAIAVAFVLALPARAEGAFMGANGRIAFERVFGGIVSVRPNGSGATRVKAHSYEPAWSPTGKRIAAVKPFFSHAMGHWMYPIVAMRANGTGVRRVTPRSWDAALPAWSPDGGSIVFLRDFLDEEDGDVLARHVYTVRIDGSGPRRITAGPFDEDPTWSPNGRWIIFSREGGLFFIRPSGRGLHPLNTGLSCAPAGDSGFHSKAVWSPDGQQLAFTHSCWDPAEEIVSSAIYTIRLDGSGLRQITFGGSYEAPEWSPNGKKIVFASDDEVAETAIYSIRADGTGGRTLVATDARRPSWQPRCNVRGTRGSDTLVGSAIRELICGFDGDDVVRAGGSNNSIFAGGGDDRLVGGPEWDVLVGGLGRDRLRGGAGNDLLNARDGIGGNDVLVGGDGNDICIADRGDIKIGCR